jgi:DnaA-homolog protein
MKQIPLAIGLDSRPAFDNFVPGSNGAALAHLQQLVLPAAPVYLCGPAGSGKTHLMQALVAQVQASGQRAAWFDAADPEPWTLEAGWSLVVVDRCDELSATAQHAAFVLFEAAAAHGVQWLAAGRQMPVGLPLRDDLRTRLAWGHVLALTPLSDSETRGALRRAADARGLFLPEEVLDWLMSRCTRQLAPLLAVLDRLDEFGLAKGRRITLPLVRQMVDEEGLPEAGA